MPVRKTKCRVLLIVNYLGLSGAEMCALRLLRGLDKSLLDARVLSYCPAEPAATAQFQDVADRCVFVDRRASRTYVHWIGRMICAVRRLRPDIIVCFGSTCTIYGHLVGLVNRIPAFVTVKGNVAVPTGMLAWLERASRFSPEIHIGVSHAACDIIREYSHVPSHRVRMAYNGICLDEFSRSTPREKVRSELGFGTNAHVVTCVATLSQCKNHTLLFRAAQRVAKADPSCVFLLVGNDSFDYGTTGSDGKAVSNRAHLERLARELCIERNVVFAGPRGDVVDILGITDVFVMPSWDEGLNVAAIEAMALEVPAVVTAVGGLKEVVLEGVTGYLVPSDNDDAMAERILQLLGSPAQREHFGRAGRERAERLFTIEEMVQKYQDIFLELWHGV